MLRHVAIIIYFICVFSVASEILNLYEGSKCSRNDQTGKCVSVYRCLSSKLDLKTRDFPPICSFKDKEPIVCCTDCELVNDTRNIILDERIGIIHRTGPKAKNQCIDYLLALDYPCKNSGGAQIRSSTNLQRNCNDVVASYPASASSGVPAKRAEFPHMALLGYGDSIDNAQWLCGGSVISEKFILTAAHCLSSPAVGQVKYIALGILKRTDPSDYWQKYNVKKSIPHPEYKAPSKYNDIALLETDKPISFQNQVRPACLHTDNEEYSFATATGWGALGHRLPLADNLQAVFVSRYNAEECAKFYPPHRHLKNGYNHTTQMCYGDKFEPRDTCEGDSGGPLQTTSIGSGCMYTVLGVTSYGRQCGISGGSGMYTRVYHYVPWIESIVWP